MGMAAFMIIAGCALTVMGYRSADQDRRLMVAQLRDSELDILEVSESYEF